MFRPPHLCTVVVIFLAFAAHYIFLTVASNNTCPYEGNCTYRRQQSSTSRRAKTYKACKTLQEQCSAAQTKCCPKCCTEQEQNTQLYIVLGVFGFLLVLGVAGCVYFYVQSQKRQAVLRQGGVPGGNNMLPTPPPPQAHGYGPVSFIPGSAPGGFGPPPGPAPGGFGPPPAYAPGGYGPPPGSAPGGYGPPPGSAPGGYGPPPGSAPGGYGPPPGSFPGGYGPPPGSAPGGYGPPSPPPFPPGGYSGQAPGGYQPPQEKTGGPPM